MNNDTAFFLFEVLFFQRNELYLSWIYCKVDLPDGFILPAVNGYRIISRQDPVVQIRIDQLFIGVIRRNGYVLIVNFLFGLTEEKKIFRISIFRVRLVLDLFGSPNHKLTAVVFQDIDYDVFSYITADLMQVGQVFRYEHDIGVQLFSPVGVQDPHVQSDAIFFLKYISEDNEI